MQIQCQENQNPKLNTVVTAPTTDLQSHKPRRQLNKYTSSVEAISEKLGFGDENIERTLRLKFETLTMVTLKERSSEPKKGLSVRLGTGLCSRD